MTFDPKEARALVDLIRSAVKFANLAAGEGVSIADSQPEDFLMAYTDATGFDDWDNLDSHAADALTAALDENERLRYVLDGVAAAIDTGRNEPLQICRDQIEIARAALTPGDKP